MKKLLLGAVCLAALVSLSGCAILVATGAVGAVGMDTIRLERYISTTDAWNTVHEVLKDMQAQVISEDKSQGTLSAKLNNEEIGIEVISVDTQLTAINVKVREKGLPALSKADAIVDKINAKISEWKKSHADKDLP